MARAKKYRDIKVTNYDRNGKVIEDLSKIKIPRERQVRLLNKINRQKELEALEAQKR